MILNDKINSYKNNSKDKETVDYETFFCGKKGYTIETP